MSLFMDYGPDWPPAPPRPRMGWTCKTQAQRPRRSLAARCAWWTTVYTLIAVVGLIGLHVRQAQIELDARTPIDGAGTSVTTTLSPHPATARRRP